MKAFDLCLIKHYAKIVHPVGWRYITITMVVASLAAFIVPKMLCVGFVFSLWCGFFFRDPSRVTPTREGLLVSPADGVIRAISTVVPPVELGLEPLEACKISVFLSVFDVHINRIPIAGTVEKKIYRPGKHINACFDKASTDNEAMAMRLRLPDGRAIGVVQIAGLIARRIVSYVSEGQAVVAGERFGMIKFGSRVDIYLPAGVAPLVVAGQYLLGGETVIADLLSNEAPRVGEIR
ncbi:MAG: phosphatidylserine decarboxylase [Rhodospirillaceae bacterium]